MESIERFFQLSQLIDDIKEKHLTLIYERQNIKKIRKDCLHKGYKYSTNKLKCLYNKGIEECSEEIRLIDKAICFCSVQCNNEINDRLESLKTLRESPSKVEKGHLMYLLDHEAKDLPIWNGNGNPPPLCGSLRPSCNYIAQPGDKVAAFIKGLNPLKKSQYSQINFPAFSSDLLKQNNLDTSLCNDSSSLKSTLTESVTNIKLKKPPLEIPRNDKCLLLSNPSQRTSSDLIVSTTCNNISNINFKEIKKYESDLPNRVLRSNPYSTIPVTIAGNIRTDKVHSSIENIYPTIKIKTANAADLVTKLKPLTVDLGPLLLSINNHPVVASPSSQTRRYNVTTGVNCGNSGSSNILYHRNNLSTLVPPLPCNKNSGKLNGDRLLHQNCHNSRGEYPCVTKDGHLFYDNTVAATYKVNRKAAEIAKKNLNKSLNCYSPSSFSTSTPVTPSPVHNKASPVSDIQLQNFKHSKRKKMSDGVVAIARNDSTFFDLSINNNKSDSLIKESTLPPCDDTQRLGRNNSSRPPLVQVEGVKKIEVEIKKEEDEEVVEDHSLFLDHEDEHVWILAQIVKFIPHPSITSTTTTNYNNNHNPKSRITNLHNHSSLVNSHGSKSNLIHHHHQKRRHQDKVNNFKKFAAVIPNENTSTTNTAKSSYRSMTYQNDIEDHLYRPSSSTKLTHKQSKILLSSARADTRKVHGAPLSSPVKVDGEYMAPGYYEIMDIDENQERFLINSKNVIPLPKYRAPDPHVHPKAFFKHGTLVLARYPQTTCFYRALIQEIDHQQSNHRFLLKQNQPLSSLLGTSNNNTLFFPTTQDDHLKSTTSLFSHTKLPHASTAAPAILNSNSQLLPKGFTCVNNNNAHRYHSSPYVLNDDRENTGGQQQQHVIIPTTKGNKGNNPYYSPLGGSLTPNPSANTRKAMKYMYGSSQQLQRHNDKHPTTVVSTKDPNPMPHDLYECYSVIFEDPLYPDGYSPPLQIQQRYVLPYKNGTDNANLFLFLPPDPPKIKRDTSKYN